jgi:hypothetical protein
MRDCRLIGSALLYLVCAGYAASVNAPRLRREAAYAEDAGAALRAHDAIRLQVLSRRAASSPISLVEALENPGNAANATQQTDRTLQSGHPTNDVDTTANTDITTDDGVKTQSTVVENNAVEATTEDSASVHLLQTPTAHDTLTPSSTPLSTRGPVSTAVSADGQEALTQLRSGSVDELSVIAEVGSREEGKAGRVVHGTRETM